VRDSLGESAIIVSTHQEADGPARIIAAVEPVEAANEDFAETFPEDWVEGWPEVPAADPDLEDRAAYLRQALLGHGVPHRLADRLAGLAAAEDTLGAAAALTHAFDRQLGFAPLEPFTDGMAPLALIGPPGAGKTITAAKICARAHMAKQTVLPVSTDTKRAGGVEQLAAFTRILDLDLETAADPDALAAVVRAHRDQPGRMVIDTAGTNPYHRADMDLLARFLDAADAEPVLVLPAGGDATEAADMACIYAAAGATRLIATRMDIARRFGGIIAAADAARLPLADISISHQVAKGLSPITPGVLARLIMPGENGPDIFTDADEDRT